MGRCRIRRATRGRATPAPLALLLAASAALALAACDSFSLPDQYLLPGEGALALALEADGASAVRLAGTVGLRPTGGTPPYAFSVTASDLYDGTKGFDKGDVGEAPYVYSAGGAIGTMRITVTDGAGASDSVLVRVLPPSPSFTIAQRTGSGNTVQLQWDFEDTALIDRFRLECSIDGQAYGSVLEPTKGSVWYESNFLSTGSVYSYRMYAVSGSYESEPRTTTLAPLSP